MRRIQFAKKALWGSVGLTGIAIILLTVGFLGGFVQGLLELILDHPIIAGFLPGFGLIPLVHSAKQKVQFRYYEIVDHSEMADSSAVVQEASYEVPVAGWAHKYTTTVYQATGFDQDIQLAFAWTKDAETKRWEQGAANQNVLEYMTEHWNANSLTEHQTTFPAQLFYIENAVDASDYGVITQSNKYGGPGRWYEQGETINASMSFRYDASNPAAGVLHVLSILTFIVGAFDRNKRNPEEIAPWVTITGEALGTTDSGFSWAANTNMRIANMRMTVWQGMDTSNKAWISIHKNAPDLSLASDAVELHMKPWMEITLPIQDGTAGTGQEYNPTVTNYARGPFYLKKGEFLQVRMDNVASYFILQYQYIPDYEYTSEFFVRSESGAYSADFQAQYLAMFSVPYDMYITSIEGHLSIITDSSSDMISSVQLVGFKNQNMLDSNDLLLGWATGDVEGRILGADSQAGAMPWNLKNIPIAIDGTSTETAVGMAKFSEAIADFYPAGAIIGIWLPSNFTTNIGSYVIEMNIEGLNRIKTATVGTNMLEGALISNMEAVSV